MTSNGKESRLSVHEVIVRRTLEDEPFAVQFGYTRKVYSDDQPYQRQNHLDKNAATEEWKRLDCGWLQDNVGMLVISNDEGKFFEVNPTREQQEEVEKRVIEIATSSQDKENGKVWLVPSNEPFKGFPSDPSDLWIRSQHGIAKYTLTVFPR